jgi:hypothetical protein
VQSAFVVTPPFDDIPTPIAAVVSGAVTDSPSFSHMILVHFLFSQVLLYEGIDACLTQNGIYVALSEKIFLLIFTKK